MEVLGGEFFQDDPDFKASISELIRDREITGLSRGVSGINGKKELVRLKNGTAGYGGKTIFTNLNIDIHTGDHTLVTGPNGCGKSTLLQMIIGDHPACYQNDLRLFGIQRGTGESIWEIKADMGIVSPDLHRNYHVPGDALHCIISGLYDSIGLYRQYTGRDEESAMKWLDRLGLVRQARVAFRQLSYADQRLVLIARALIKVPRLLILDEPTHGLDEPNRKAVLDFLEQVAKENLSTILYVSHRRDEFRDFFRCQVRF
jgi:molybdate transport system ATP-binding protein